MSRLQLGMVGFIFCIGCLVAQEKVAEERMKVEVYFESENVPKNAKAGDKVDLKMIVGKTKRPRGEPLIQTRPVAGDLEIAALEVVNKPADPEAAVRVEMLMPAPAAEKLQKIREQKVEEVERTDNGRVVRKMIPIHLRLEPTKPRK